jgi:ABC-type oligopeptide transport system substrate-binding subunit
MARGVFMKRGMARIKTALAGAAMALAVPLAACAEQPQIATLPDQPVAVGGYDPMGYFLIRQPVKGSPFLELVYQGTIWRFSSESNRGAFQSDQAKFAPQFGGYCALSISEGKAIAASPTAWRIEDGKLYLFRDKAALADWMKDSKGHLSEAQSRWPLVLDK